MGLPIMAMAQQIREQSADTWAVLSGRCFFAWRMAAAGESALREVHFAMDQQRDPERMQALEMASRLLRKELVRWVRRGEALGMSVGRPPRPPLVSPRSAAKKAQPAAGPFDFGPPPLPLDGARRPHHYLRPLVL